jgi:hypothetical protein
MFWLFAHKVRKATELPHSFVLTLSIILYLFFQSNALYRIISSLYAVFGLRFKWHLMGVKYIALSKFSIHIYLRVLNILLSTHHSNIYFPSIISFLILFRTGFRQHSFKHLRNIIYIDLNEIMFCNISGSHNGEYKNNSLPGYSAVRSRRSRPTFQRSLLPPSSGRPNS